MCPHEGCRKIRTKKILFLDELPWMAAGRSRLVSLLKYYWDNHWKGRHVMLILCGSVASFMVKKALISLYGPDNSLKDAGYFHYFVTLLEGCQDQAVEESEIG